MKVNSTVYKGIEFVEISALPPDQRTILLETIDPDLLIKIMVDGKLIPRCLQFKDYEAWYDSSFARFGGGLKESKPVSTSLEEKVKADLPA
jgi:hypothetical protein